MNGKYRLDSLGACWSKKNITTFDLIKPADDRRLGGVAT